MYQLLAIILLISAIVLLILTIKLSGEKKAAEKAATEAEANWKKARLVIKTNTTRIEELEAINSSLSRWQSVQDADKKAREIIGLANAELENAKKLTQDASVQAASVINTAKAEAATITHTAKERAKQLEVDATRALGSASAQAGKIIDAANKNAEEIAGSAYEAMKNAEKLESTVKAMQNIIEGYGDKYLIPSHSLLDDLAEEFGFHEAGLALKNARELTRHMIQMKTAASCEYVEHNRRDTAISFAIDAFNGKVDSILSRVKSDNFGRLEQEIKDAFALVNHNGKAFRDARITPDFLASRLDELKWASVVQQLKVEEKEEQRRIKEQIREEEKARREYERAIKDAEKEESLIRKAMQKAQEQIVKASEEQKAMYEKQLLELSEKLKAAEEKNQRALSMAQQTKRGHVYIISNIGSFGENVYKIGVTRRLEPLDRIRELGDSSVPFGFDVHAMIFSEDAPALENQLHKHFVLMQMNKVNYRKEFFRVDLPHIREEVEKFGLSAKWTMAALAQEYHESLSIEKAIMEDPRKRDAWIKRQLLLEPVSFIEDSNGLDTSYDSESEKNQIPMAVS